MPIPAKPKEQQPKTAKERVYSELKTWIVNGTLQPNEKISDVEIAQYFSVSRTPVREAIQMLADQKLIDIIPGKLSRVSPIDFERTSSAYKIASELNALAVEYAAPNVNEKTLEEMTAANEKFRLACQTGNIVEINECDRAFHAILINLSNNYFLKEFLDTLTNHIQRMENVYFKELQNSKKSYEEHKQIIEALRNHDTEAAKQAMRYNWIHTIEILDEKHV